MKTERAQELYSEYAEGTLTPALRQALEQHFEADPNARADYAQFLADLRAAGAAARRRAGSAAGLPGEDFRARH